MKASYKRILIILAILIAGVLIWYFFIRKPEQPIVFQTQKPAYGYIAQSVTATGRIQPEDTVTVGTQVSGIIKYLYADFNSQVKKGEKIAELDKSLLQATVDQFTGNLQNAQSQLVYAKANFDRQALLFKTDAISKADYDNALNIYNAAKANVGSAQAQVRSAQKNLSYADIYSPIDGVVLNRNINIGQTVAASFSTPTLFVIAKDITKMEVQANVDEADIGAVKTGDRVSFTVDAFITDEFKGIVKEIRLNPSVSANVVTYRTIINTGNDDMKLKPGMTANIMIYTKEADSALLVPAKALAFVPDSSLAKDYEIVGKIGRKSSRSQMGGAGGGAGPGGGGIAGGGAAAPQKAHARSSRTDKSGIAKETAFVWVLKGKKLVRTKITTGLNDNTQVQVLSGLTVNDEVISGVTGGATGGTAQAATGGSPFMPQRTRGGGGGGGRGR